MHLQVNDIFFIIPCLALLYYAQHFLMSWLILMFSSFPVVFPLCLTLCVLLAMHVLGALNYRYIYASYLRYTPRNSDYDKLDITHPQIQCICLNGSWCENMKSRELTRKTQGRELVCLHSSNSKWSVKLLCMRHFKSDYPSHCSFKITVLIMSCLYSTLSSANKSVFPCGATDQRPFKTMIRKLLKSFYMCGVNTALLLQSNGEHSLFYMKSSSFGCIFITLSMQRSQRWRNSEDKLMCLSLENLRSIFLDQEHI